MKSKLVSREPGKKTYVLVLDSGEEAFSAITRFAVQEGMDGASLTAIGAFERAKVGWLNPDTWEYKPIPIDEQCEVLSIVGDIARGDDGQSSLHAHIVLGLSDGSTRGGHLMEGIVRPTLEVTIVESATYLRRRVRPDLGIALIDLP